MSFLDALTGSAANRAAKNNMAAIVAGQNQANTTLNDAYGNAEGFLSNGALPALGQGYGQARQDVAGQYAQTQGFLGQQANLYDHMAAGGQGAYDRYLDATGANGAAGSEAATAAFRAAPGYEYQRDQALEAVQRSAAARGGLAGGNATADILKTATGLADQSYQQYVQSLGNAAGSYGTALAGKAAGLGAQANASQNFGTQLGALGTGLGTAQAGVYGQLGGLEAARGGAQAGVIGNATNALVQNNNTQAASQAQASANSLNALGGLFKGAMSLGNLFG